MVDAAFSRVTKAYASGYQRARVHQSRLVRGEIRPLVVDFNGALPSGELIATATWRTNQNWAAILSDAEISHDQRSTSVTLQAGFGAAAIVKATVTLVGGASYTQLFQILVQATPWFVGEPYPTTPGPQELTASA